MSIKISVVIPTYKPDYTLYECLDSLKKQTLNCEMFEVIIVLNGDKKPYEEEINNYIKTSSLNINFVYAEEKGVSNARNVGIRLATGEYITFIDSDDWVSENYLLGLLEKTNNSHFAFANVQCYNVDTEEFFTDYLGTKFNSLQKNKLFSHLKITSYFSTPVAKLLPTNICKENNFSRDYDYGEDALFMFSVEPYLPKGIKSNENVIYFRRCVKDSLSRKKRSKKEILKIHLSLLKNYWKIYLKNTWKYNIMFFINRNLAIIKHIIMCK
ncbi:MAG: glycosyltransferase family 2 protein [Spirochaetaceae bacterium]|nr:glycosyltransferase family 2 protein [Spirochaetaceae bacterium]